MNYLTKLGFGIVIGLCVVLAGGRLLAADRMGTAPGPSGTIVVSPTSADFGEAVEQVQSVTRLIEVRNDGVSNLMVTGFQMLGANAGDFHFSAEWPFLLPPGEQRQIVVSFEPASQGPKEAVLRILSNATNQSQTDVSLRGAGVGLETLGRVTASVVPNNAAVQPNDLITVEVRVDMNGARPPAHLLQNYQASLTWDRTVVTFQGFALGDAPWHSPASIGQIPGGAMWFDSVFNGAGGNFALIRFKFKVIGGVGSSTRFDLEFLRMEGKEVENLRPILTVNDQTVQVVAEAAPADIEVSPASHDYGAVNHGESGSQTFVVRNAGMQSLVVSAPRLQGDNADQFSIVSGGGAFTLAEGQSREITVSYNPTYLGTKAATLVFQSNDPDEGFFYIPLSGSVLAPDIDVQPGSLHFGEVEVGGSASRNLLITNRGTAPLVLTQFGLDGHQNQFAYNIGLLAVLEPGQSATVSVFFRPTTEGGKNANLVIHSNDPDEVSVTIPLRGTGVPRQ
jgi:Abnormal spindle-like microcephaly-assoc'd, ASPM-SPD-2-Hydin